MKIEDLHRALPRHGSGRHLHDICAEFDIPSRERALSVQLAQQLVQYRLIEEISPLTFIRVRDTLLGTLSLNPKGFGFVEPELCEGPNIFVNPLDLEGARHRDRVELIIYTAEDGRIRGRVSRILERGVETCVGVLRHQDGGFWLSPQNDRLPPSIPVIPSGLEGEISLEEIEEGAMIAVILSDEGDRGELFAHPLHVITPQDPQGALETVIYNQGLRLHLARAAQEEAELFPDEPSPEELRRRRDLRHLPFITIDPDTAQDFDDAIYAQPRRGEEGSGWILWVAIADVAHYVRHGGEIDREAQSRSATLYLPAQAFPMLPHRLSNHLCSLKPKVDRLAMVAQIEVTPHGELGEVKLSEAIIHSQARLTYDEAATLLGILPPRELPKFITRHLAHVTEIRDCARALKNRRRRRGFLNLDLVEPRINFDLSGMVGGFKVAPRHEAHEMVEEAMLAANESIAALCIQSSIPALYRIHATPPDRGVERFEIQSELLGAPYEAKKKVKAHHLSRYLKQHENHPQSELLSSLLLRAMSRAVYEPNPGLHFGLGTETYLHFTSPIRRYPDLWVHRQLKSWLNQREAVAADEAHEVAAYASRRERMIMEAERKVLDAYKALFMTDHIGETLSGVVCQSSPKGFMVDLDDYPVWCSHRVEDLPSSFRFDEKTFAWRDVVRRRQIGLGTTVEVTIIASKIIEGRVEVKLSDL